MSYQALYRKYRSKNFDEVVGQGHVVETLKNQIKSDRVAHAYLLCGIRGTGKTSIAKIFAKAVNCESPVDGNPCLECEICKGINDSSNLNIIEIDAASNNGVDNIREIREEVNYMPTKGKYKVYIIDEVHMLSISAFNALLKTLEEPPKHVIFILATTEPQKIPATILSRCQRFDLKRISVKEITGNLTKIAELENIEVDEKALKYIAKLSDGSMRDSLSIFDQVITFNKEGMITLSLVLEVLGIVDDRVYYELIEALKEKDSAKCIKIVNDIYMNGKDIRQFISQMVEYLRNLVIVSTTHEPETILELSEENIDTLKQLANSLNYNIITTYISEFSRLESEAKYDGHPKIMLEIALLKMCQPALSDDYEDYVSRLEKVEQMLKNGVRVNLESERVNENAGASLSAPKTKPVTPEAEPQSKPKVQEAPRPAMTNIKSDDLKAIQNMWHDIRDHFREPIKSMLVDAEARQLEEGTYHIVCSDNIAQNYIEKNLGDIKGKFEEIVNKACVVKVMTKNEYKEKVQSQGNMNNETDKKENYDSESLDKVEDMFKSFGVDVETVE